MVDVDTLANAIWGQESGRGANTKTSVTGAVGDMQIQPGTFAQYARPGESINNKADNIAVGHRIIADLYAKAGGDPARVAVGYFSGPANIAPLGSPTPYIHDFKDPNGKYTSSYASDVTNRLGVPGTTLNSVPMDPSIMARGGVASPPVTTAVTPAPAPSIAQNLGKGDVGAALQQLTANKTDAAGNEAKGSSPLDKLADAFKPKQPPQMPSPPMLQPTPDNSAVAGPAAAQLFSQLVASAGKPLSWSSRPPGSNAGPQGMTLNSAGQTYV